MRAKIPDLIETETSKMPRNCVPYMSIRVKYSWDRWSKRKTKEKDILYSSLACLSNI